MKAIRVAFIICFLVSLTMFGYNNGEVVKAESSETNANQETPKAEHETQTTEAPQASDTTQTTETVKTNTEKPAEPQKAKTVNIEFVKENLVIGISKKQVETLLGPKYVEVTSGLDGSQMWRYDVAAKTDYQFANFLDEVDLTAIKAGTLNMQLFITWNDKGAVEHVAAYYKNDNDHLLHEYMKFSTGDTKDNAIE